MQFTHWIWVLHYGVHPCCTYFTWTLGFFFLSDLRGVQYLVCVWVVLRVFSVQMKWLKTTKWNALINQFQIHHDQNGRTHIYLGNDSHFATVLSQNLVDLTQTHFFRVLGLWKLNDVDLPNISLQILDLFLVHPNTRISYTKNNLFIWNFIICL